MIVFFVNILYVHMYNLYITCFLSSCEAYLNLNMYVVYYNMKILTITLKDWKLLGDENSQNLFQYIIFDWLFFFLFFVFFCNVNGNWFESVLVFP
jgi:hypothetical protein